MSNAIIAVNLAPTALSVLFLIVTAWKRLYHHIHNIVVLVIIFIMCAAHYINVFLLPNTYSIAVQVFWAACLSLISITAFSTNYIEWRKENLENECNCND